MNSEVSVTLSLAQHDVDSVCEELVRPLFERTEAVCSRFIRGNPLDALNRAPDETQPVPKALFLAIAAAYESYELTDGLFDPRVITALQTLGYDESFGTNPSPHGTTHSEDNEPPGGVWRPGLSNRRGEYLVNLGGHPIDLGGVAKGHTVDLAVEILKPLAKAGYINAGGDLQVWGLSQDDRPWRVGIENPIGSGTVNPIAVIEVTNTGIATTSSRKRQWHVEDGGLVHHIIDPRTFRSAHNAIKSVTVTHPQTRVAEALTKALFLAGERHIASAAELSGALALWVTEDGSVQTSSRLREAVIWRQTT